MPKRTQGLHQPKEDKAMRNIEVISNVVVKNDEDVTDVADTIYIMRKMAARSKPKKYVRVVVEIFQDLPDIPKEAENEDSR
jgi:hypothetical protein